MVIHDKQNPIFFTLDVSQITNISYHDPMLAMQGTVISPKNVLRLIVSSRLAPLIVAEECALDVMRMTPGRTTGIGEMDKDSMCRTLSEPPSG